tara:strand:- start:662 stop:808 length:147 start_codon:yes stop_codon:yes gene_type:complete
MKPKYLIPFIGPAFANNAEFSIKLFLSIYNLAIFLVTMNIVTYLILSE